MAYIDIKRQLEELSNENYKDFIKALISIEKGIENENILDEVYEEYMDNDSFSLLSEDFDNIIDEIKEHEKIVEENLNLTLNLKNQPKQETFYETFKCKNKIDLYNKVINNDPSVKDLVEYIEYKSKNNEIDRNQLTSPDEIVELVSKLPIDKSKIYSVFVNTKNTVQFIKEYKLSDFKNYSDLAIEILKDKYKGLYKAFFIADSELNFERNSSFEKSFIDSGLLDIISYKEDNMYYSYLASRNVYAPINKEEIQTSIKKDNSYLNNDEFNKYYSREKNVGLNFIDSNEEVLKNIKVGYDTLKREEMGIIIYDEDYRILDQKELFSGGVSSTLTDPNVILSEILNTKNAYGFALFHNNPSGYVNPSKEDIITTKFLVNAAAQIGIKVSDHFVISQEKVEGIVKNDISKFDSNGIDENYKQKIMKPELEKNGMEWLLEI